MRKTSLSSSQSHREKNEEPEIAKCMHKDFMKKGSDVK